MTLTVCFIEGRKGSACGNNAFSVVRDNDLIDIIPVAALKGKNAGDVRAAFENAQRMAEHPVWQKYLARKTLGLSAA